MSFLDNKNPGNNIGWTPLHSAADGGHVIVYGYIMTFLENKNPGTTDNSQTPLHNAALRGHLNVCQFIVETTGDKNPTMVDGRTPLDMAQQYGHAQIIEYLSE